MHNKKFKKENKKAKEAMINMLHRQVEFKATMKSIDRGLNNLEASTPKLERLADKLAELVAKTE